MDHEIRKEASEIYNIIADLSEDEICKLIVSDNAILVKEVIQYHYFDSRIRPYLNSHSSVENLQYLKTRIHQNIIRKLFIPNITVQPTSLRYDLEIINSLNPLGLDVKNYLKTMVSIIFRYVLFKKFSIPYPTVSVKNPCCPKIHDMYVKAVNKVFSDKEGFMDLPYLAYPYLKDFNRDIYGHASAILLPRIQYFIKYFEYILKAFEDFEPNQPVYLFKNAILLVDTCNRDPSSDIIPSLKYFVASNKKVRKYNTVYYFNILTGNVFCYNYTNVDLRNAVSCIELIYQDRIKKQETDENFKKIFQEIESLISG